MDTSKQERLLRGEQLYYSGLFCWEAAQEVGLRETQLRGFIQRRRVEGIATSGRAPRMKLSQKRCQDGFTS